MLLDSTDQIFSVSGNGFPFVPILRANIWHELELIYPFLLYVQQTDSLPPIESMGECVPSLKGPDSYSLARHLTFPPCKHADQIKLFIPFEANRGHYILPP